MREEIIQNINKYLKIEKRHTIFIPLDEFNNIKNSKKI